MELSRTDIESAMRRALELAARGPAYGINPQVGCVLLDDAGSIVSEGWHRGAGTPHAEVDALTNLAGIPLAAGTPPPQATPGTTTGTGTGTDKLDRGLTAVVTLEPCNHTGRTGPCTEALISAGVTRVVYAVPDPGPLARGGAGRLLEAGVQVTGGVLIAEVSELIHPWLVATTLRRPYVTVKWASTLDGRAAASDGTSQWITGTESLRRVHEQRAAVDAILVGTGTVLADNPSLTARGVHEALLDHQPIPVVVGERPVPVRARLRDHPAGLIETGSRDLPAILYDLFDRGIRRVIVEGGPTLATAFVAADLVDEYAIFLGPSLLGGSHLVLGDIGVATLVQRKNLELDGVEQLGNDVFISARPVDPRGDTTPAIATTPVMDAAPAIDTAPVIEAVPAIEAVAAIVAAPAIERAEISTTRSAHRTVPSSSTDSNPNGP